MNVNILEIGALAAALVGFGLLYYLHRRRVNFGIRTLVGTAIGVVIGLIFRENYTYVAAFGSIYAGALQAFVVPLLLFSVISSITNLGESIRLQKVGLKSVLFLLLNTFTASVLTLAAAVGLGIGRGFNYTLDAEAQAAEVPTVVDTIVGLFPRNVITSWGNNAVVPIIVFALVIGIAYNKVRKHDESVTVFKSFVDAGNKVLGKAINWIVGFTPYAVTSLMARAVGRSNVADLLPLLTVLVVAYVLCAVQLFGVEALLIRFIGGLNPIHFFRKIAPAGVVAFTSQSSVGTLPVTIGQLREELGVDEDVASFTTSLGANLGMPGCAGVWPVLTAVFAIHASGIHYSVPQYLSLIALALLVSIGTVGVPGTATITATALFAAAGLPVELIVLLSPISSIVDMARTATNVVGAATASVLVAKTEGLLDEDAYNRVPKKKTTSSTEETAAEKAA